jgi:hypothetical protein
MRSVTSHRKLAACAERMLVEYALFMLYGCSVPIRVIEVFWSSLGSLRDNGSPKMFHFHVLFEVCMSSGLRRIVDVIDFSILYTISIYPNDAHRNGLHVKQSYFSVLDTRTARESSRDHSPIVYYARICKFTEAVFKIARIPECLTDRFIVTSINGIRQ